MLDCFLLILCLLVLVALPAAGETPPPRQGVTLYVSKLGDNSDGSSWANAFTTIQAALDAVPDDQGGHRIVVRPDTYFEANLFAAHKGAPGAYNELIGDARRRARLRHQRLGRHRLRRPRPEGLQELRLVGHRSRAYYQGLVAGAHRAHLLRHRLGPLAPARPLRHRRRRRPLLRRHRPGRAVQRRRRGLRQHRPGLRRRRGELPVAPDEPITFRRCHLWALDWWGDTAGRLRPRREPGHARAARRRLRGLHRSSARSARSRPATSASTPSPAFGSSRCRLVALNFSQPARHAHRRHHPERAGGQAPARGPRGLAR